MASLSRGSKLAERGRESGLAALPARAAQELQDLERELGGRQALVGALTYAPQTKDLRYVLGLLGDPDHASLSLAEVCRMGRILPGDLVDALAKGTELRSRLVAQQRVARRLPAVVEDVMHRATAFEDDCPACQGLGQTTPDPTPDLPNPEPAACPQCLGHGKLRYDADSKCRELALELGGLIGKGGGGISIVNQQLQVQTPQGGGSLLGLERMQEALDDLLYGQHPGLGEEVETDAVVVEAEVAGEAAPGAAAAADPAEAPGAEESPT